MKKLMFLGTFVFMVISCSVDKAPEIQDNLSEINLSFEDVICGEATSHSFGDLGSVMVFNDSENLIVRFISSDPTGLVQARVEIVDKYSEFPVNGGGNLPIGQMGEVIHVGGEWYAQFTFPLSNFAKFEDNCLLIAPWAIFNANGGTHWAGDQTAGNENNSWRYFSFCIQSCPPVVQEPVIICETAFMKGNRPFLGKNLSYPLNLGNSRWGWANYYAGGNGQIYEELWAGAGKNDTSKATLVGYVTTTISGNNVTVRIDMEPGFENALNLTHIYFSSRTPTTTAPGQYGNIDEHPENGQEYNFTHNGPFWLIVHAEICQEE